VEVTRRCLTGVTHRAEVLTDRHAVADLEGLGDRLEVGHVVANSVISEDRNRTTSARCRVVDTRIPGQEMMFDVIAAMFDVAQARGLIDLGLDTRAYAAWFHGMTLGRTVTEAGSVGTDAWLAVAIPAALAPLRPPAQP